MAISAPLKYDRREISKRPAIRKTRKVHKRHENTTGSSDDAHLIQEAYARFWVNLNAATYVPWKFHPRDAIHDPQRSNDLTSVSSIAIRRIDSACSASSAKHDVDESYSLDVYVNGSILIQAASANGAMYGLTTLSQLFYATNQGEAYTNLAPVSIQDRPKYEHRGLNIDIARNYYPPETIMHLIDGMAYTKLNRLHLHATDSQSWPLEIPSMPDLAAKGAYHPSAIWAAAQLKDVQEYARARGIQTIVEIDAPGHTAAIAYSRPDLVVAWNQHPWADYCAEPPCGQVSLRNNATFDFFDQLYADLLPRVRPYAGYFHAGGDEFKANPYKHDPFINTNDTATIRTLLQPFVEHLHNGIRAQGLRPLVWEELVLEWDLPLPKDDVLVQTWTSNATLRNVTAKGYKALFGDVDHWYLDCGYGAFIDYNDTAAPKAVPTYADWCATPQKSWRAVLAYDPTANLTDAQRQLLAGGEVHLWGELTDAASLDGKVWPRAAAAAEVLWSGPRGAAGVDEEATRRLADFRERLVAMGFGAAVVQMAWCLQNRGECVQ